MLTNTDKSWILQQIKSAKDELRKELWGGNDDALSKHLTVKDIAGAAFVPMTENGTVPIEKAAEHPDLYEQWAGGQHYTVGRILYRPETDYLYRVRQEHDSLAVYQPEITPALYERIPKPHEGEHDTPIPYDASIGMALNEGKYYTDDDVLYLCTRDTGIPVYQPLSALVGLYVEVSA